MESDLHKVWLSIGSNHPDAVSFVDSAVGMLEPLLSNWKMCEPYTTPAINGVDPDYLNAVVFGEWAGDEKELNRLFKEIEDRLGRSRNDRHIVEIDLDLVCFDDEVLRPKDFSREYFARGFRALKEDC